MPVGQLLGSMTHREFTEWAIYDRLYGPIGLDRFDVGSAVIAKTVADVAGAKNTRLGQFMPLMKGAQCQTDGQMKAQFEMFKRAIERRRAKADQCHKSET